jgi:hypothetical protein
MTGQGLRAVLLAGAIAAGAGPASGLEAGGLDVAQLARTATAKGCKTGPTDYVAGYFAPDDTLSGVFWCRANLDDLDPQFLIIVVDQHSWRRMSCPHTMQSVNRPLGLRILRDAQVPLSWFHSPSDMAKTGPVGGYTTGPVIDTGDGGVGEQWICHDGAWLVYVYH